TPVEVEVRTRQRISHPSFSLPEVTVGVCSQHLLDVEQLEVDRSPEPDQISPEPWPAAAGSCSTCVSSRSCRDSGSAP
ncbi:hypothetical protein, partial [Streptosporangium amethystogenes]|uniref:hypothetical protein n=1 Tax=Streptosporangium amethystogenes TaxID=2002 RepID=UPI001B80C900